MFNFKKYFFTITFLLLLNQIQTKITKNVEIIYRNGWNAKPPKQTLSNITAKYADKVIIIHTVSGWCYNKDACISNVKSIQRYHMTSLDFIDIGYNFLIGGDGRVYEGRGWNKKGEHTKGFNDNSVAIAFIGTFIDVEPTARQLQAAQQLIEEGLALKKISPAYKLFGHCQLTNTLSPGNALYKIIQGWSHWSESNDNISDSSELRIVTRDAWQAKPPVNELQNLEIPVSRVIIAHTATEGCDDQTTCTYRIRSIQTFHIESRKFDDIAYNFLVGGDGAVYEGRGWDKEGAHTKGYNKGSICIAFIGNFLSIEPSGKQLKAAKLIIQEGVRLGKLTPDYKLFGHCQLTNTLSPGNALYEIIQGWNHWSESV